MNVSGLIIPGNWYEPIKAEPGMTFRVIAGVTKTQYSGDWSIEPEAVIAVITRVHENPS